MISIIVTAFNNTNYIKEALESIVDSCEGLEFEILVGVDNCKKTFEYLVSIEKKLNKNIKIFFFKKNVGTYVVRNSLVLKSNHNYILFFDSDDIMRKILIPKVIEGLKSYDYIRYSYESFNGVLKKNTTDEVEFKTPIYHAGTFGIKKEIFLQMNGFEPWICASDGEFYWRISTNNFKIKNLDIVGLFYRRHSSNLTISNTTGMNSPLRKKYHKLKEEKQKNKNHQPLDKLFIEECILYDKNYTEITKFFPTIKIENNFFTQKKEIKIENNFFTQKKEITIIIPTFSIVNLLKETLDSVIKSIKNINCEILVGIDNCSRTLNYVKSSQFDSRIKFYFFEKNVGPYVVKNSLVKIANSNLVLFFDSDDIMSENMVIDILSLHKVKDMIKPRYVDFRENVNNKDKKHQYGEGVFSIKKSIFLSINGFEPWRCAADSDIMSRLYKSGINFDYTKDISFFRRVHKDSLTQKPETNLGSKLRATYVKMSKSKKGQIKLPTLVTEKFYEVHPNSLIPFNPPIEKVEIPVPVIIPSPVEKLKGILKSGKPKGVDYEKINDTLKQQGIYNPNLIKEKPKIKQNNPIDRNKLIEIKKGSAVDSLRRNLPNKPNRRKDLPNIFSKKK